MQLALYRAERPEVFEDIIGQKQIVKILQNQIKTGTVSQAYLFTGTHGTGKTTTARILAKAVNCLDGEPGTDANLPCGKCDNCEAIREGKFVDVIELDAASNNGVDDLRAIIDLVKYPPTVGRYKVYIIDEVHMLSQAAENAFLKTLEEPPEYAIFILATTDPQKVRATIRSRCMQLNFKRVSEEELVAGMQRICDKKGVTATPDALGTIASKADGSVRDALSILEQCMAAGDEKLDKDLVLEYTGSAGEDFYLALTGAVESNDLGKALLYIDEIIKRGKDAKQILKDWLEHYRNLMVVKYVNKADRIISSSKENIARLKEQSDSIGIKEIEKAIRLISEYINLGRYSDRPRILLETVAVRLTGDDAPIEKPKRAEVPKPAVERKPAVTPVAKSEPVVTREPEEPLTEIAAQPREQAGDAEKMWDRISEEISRDDRSFDSIVARHSRGDSFENNQLIVRIKSNKLALAQDKMSEIKKAANILYGDIKVSLLESENISNAQTEAVESQMVDDDVKMDELTSDIEGLFGVSVEVLDK